MSFLTLEDINSAFLKYRSVNIFHEINTADISEDEFSDVKYDFCYVSHTINGNKHIFTFEVVNYNWTGAYYFTNAEGEYLDEDAYEVGWSNYGGETLEFETSEESVKLVLYCSTATDDFDFQRITWRPVSLEPLVVSSMKPTTKEVPILNLNGEDILDYEYILNSQLKGMGVNISLPKLIEVNDEGEYIIHQEGSPNSYNYSIMLDSVVFYYDVFIKKVKPKIEINDELIIGKVNKVYLSVDNDFKKSNGYVANKYYPLLQGYVYFEDKKIPIQFDGEYFFELDLRDKIKTNTFKLSVEILETELIENGIFDFSIHSRYILIDNVSDFIKELSVNGSKIIQLAKDFALFGDIRVAHDIIIQGNGRSLNLNENSLILNEGVTLKANNLSFVNGDTAIIQNKNSILELSDCKFSNCKSSNYNNIGSCIFCDVDLESLSVDDDFTTNLSNCTFTNNHSTILHGGQLTVDNCKFRNTELKFVDLNNPAFIYQVDGDATITNSVFDIDYTNKDDLCVNNENIGFGQAIVMCGQYATINKANYNNLQADKSLPFFESPYNNKSHLFVKYYYPQINSCVFSSPLANFEDKSCCHGVSGVDWIFKNNIQITRADWENENKTNKIIWEE